MIDAKKEELFALFDTEEEAAKGILETYNMSVKEYTQEVIIPLVYDEALRTAVAEQNGAQSTDSKDLADSVLARAQAGEDFAELAAEFGTDSTNQNGGDLGWFPKGVMVEPFEEAVFTLEVGAVSNLVETEFGYHIIKLVDKGVTTTPAGEEQEQVRASHILIRDISSLEEFDTFMQQQIADATIEFLAPIHDPRDQLAPPTAF